MVSVNAMLGHILVPNPLHMLPSTLACAHTLFNPRWSAFKTLCILVAVVPMIFSGIASLHLGSLGYQSVEGGGKVDPISIFTATKEEITKMVADKKIETINRVVKETKPRAVPNTVQESYFIKQIGSQYQVVRTESDVSDPAEKRTEILHDDIATMAIAESLLERESGVNQSTYPGVNTGLLMGFIWLLFTIWFWKS